MIRIRDRILLGGSLLALFGAGAGSGFYLAERRIPPVSGPFPALAAPGAGTGAAAAPAASPDEWRSRALDHLGADLRLSEVQKQTILPLLEQSGEKMFLSRDRALFQIHLELLAFHEAVGRQAGLLDPAQKARLDDLLARLRNRIGSQFPQFLRDSPLPAATAANSP